ncbi:MAG: hypothetical protein WC740_00420 [Verrucomicrobiia bacterium]
MSSKKPAPPKPRRLWGIRPTERIKPSATVYSRKKFQLPAVDDKTG